METAQQAAASAVRAVIPMPTPAGYWQGDGVPVRPKSSFISPNRKLTFTKESMWWANPPCRRANRDLALRPAIITSFPKIRDHVSSEFGDYVDSDGNVVKSNIDVRKDSRPRGTHFDGARMPYCMHFNGGYAMHEGYVPPYAASHGCIRLPKENGPLFFRRRARRHTSDREGIIE